MLPDETVVLTGRKVRRLNLVLDCLSPHDFCSRSQNYVNLQQYVIKEKKLTEQESLLVFRQVVNVVENLHRVIQTHEIITKLSCAMTITFAICLQRNIVHRDLKLGNLVLHRQSRQITITNFCLGKHLTNESDLLRDQRGSPAYISPDVLSGKPYLGNNYTRFHQTRQNLK